MKKIKIDTECDSCSGTGLYSGFAEPKGKAVVCHGCSGTGCNTISYLPFTGRKRKRGIREVIIDSRFWFEKGRDNNETIPATEFYKLPAFIKYGFYRTL